MPKIYLSPAYHRMNPCSIEGCDETTHNNQYIDELVVYLNACGIEYYRGHRRTPMSDEDGTEIMKQAVRQSNEYVPDIHYVSHTNASNGTVRGYRPMIYPGSTEGKKIVNCLINRRKEIYGGDIRAVERSDLYELSQTTAPAVYEEHVFHDNHEDAEWFHSNMRKIAEQTAKAFCDYFGIPFVDPYIYTAADALRALQIAVGKITPSAYDIMRLDIDRDGKIETSDALSILQRAVGKI